jgi:hypothetical protein
VPEWIGELPGEDQRCLLFAAAEGLGAGAHWNALAECLGAGATLGSMEQRCFWLIAEMALELDAADVRLLGAVAPPRPAPPTCSPGSPSPMTTRYCAAS